MNNKNLTPVRYHTDNVLAILVCFCITILTMFIKIDNPWVRAPIVITGIFAVYLFDRFKKITRTDAYQEIINKGTYKAFWYVLFFSVILNPIVQILDRTNKIAYFSEYLEDYVLIQVGIIIFIREVILLKSCKENHIQ